jgi:hypothetical protein
VDWAFPSRTVLLLDLIVLDLHTSSGGHDPPLLLRNEETRRQFGSSSTTSATDRETRAVAELTDVDVFRPFEYLEDFKLLVCKLHAHAVRNVKRHLEEHHPEIRAVNNAIAVRLASLKIQGIKPVHLPTSTVTPFASLAPPSQWPLMWRSRWQVRSRQYQ